MSWQHFSLASCFLWGLTGIFCIKASATGQNNTVSFLAYVIAFVFTAFTTSISQLRSGMTYDGKSLGFAFGAGLCSALAIILQFKALAGWKDQSAWIVLIGCLNGVIVVLYTLFSGERFSVTKWMGVIFAIVAIVLLNWPSKESR
ncbi:MAG: EamA family transporter [Candidatus Taylorbacteria bacterium]|nr:EamA family transporter [Candidatus Taylorbacteria bacterium]